MLEILCLEGPLSLVFSIPSGSYILSASSSTVFSESGGEELDGGLPFRAECSEVSYCLCSVWLWFLYLIQLLQEEAFLMVAEQGT